MEIVCYRDQELLREQRQLSAANYNLARILLTRSASGVVFLPLRAMQFLAILDEQEFVFIDSERKQLIDIAWQQFHPQKRETLEDAVDFEAVYYYSHSQGLMSRLQGEFHKALLAAAAKDKRDAPARILKFERRRLRDGEALPNRASRQGSEMVVHAHLDYRVELETVHVAL